MVAPVLKSFQAQVSPPPFTCGQQAAKQELHGRLVAEAFFLLHALIC